MEANEAPKKIYINPLPNPSDGYVGIAWDEPHKTMVEYTRTDAFIEKVINFLNYKLDDVVATRVPGTIIPYHVAKQEFIEDFRNYMEGE